MKHFITAAMTAAIVLSGTAAFAEMKPGMEHKGHGKAMDKKGPGMINHDDCDRMGPGKGDMKGPMQEYGMFMRYLNLETTMEQHRINVQKIMLDAKEKKIGLNDKRRDLTRKLHELSARYASDKNAGPEITKVLKELTGVQNQISQINKDAMDKIKALNDSKDKEIKTAVDNYIKKLEGDKAELEKFTQFLNSRPAMGKDRKCDKD